MANFQKSGVGGGGLQLGTGEFHTVVNIKTLYIFGLLTMSKNPYLLLNNISLKSIQDFSIVVELLKVSEERFYHCLLLVMHLHLYRSS